MNPMFWIMVILILVFIWFLLNFLFRPIGKYITALIKETLDKFKEEERGDNT